MAQRFRVSDDFAFALALSVCAALLLAHGASASSVRGDANCDGHVDSIDAVLILQRGAGLTHNLACIAKVELNGDGSIDALDAALILQYQAGLLSSLGEPLTTPAPTPMPTPVLVLGAQFSISAAGCNTRTGPTTCTYPGEFGGFGTYVYLDRLPEGLKGYRAIKIVLAGANPTLDGLEWDWPDCEHSRDTVLSRRLFPHYQVELTCTMDSVDGALSTYVGQIAHVSFWSVCDLDIALIHGLGNTTLREGNDESGAAYPEAVDGSESVHVHCLFSG